MIFNMVGASGKKPFIPQYTGKAKLVLLGNGDSGYMEFYTSGTLTWLDDKVPRFVDMFCVGGGGGGSGGVTDPNYYAGAGGGGGYTTTVLSAPLPPAVEITIGAGGAGSARNNSYMATNK
ncbi:MAG: glycine-rich domain-containing protein, partial [Christensenellales bacterium]